MAVDRSASADAAVSAPPGSSGTRRSLLPRSSSRIVLRRQTAAAAAVFLSPWCVQSLLENLGLQGLLAEQPMKLANLVVQRPIIRRRHHLLAAAGRSQDAVRHQ